jgi:hypothetical protein
MKDASKRLRLCLCLLAVNLAVIWGSSLMDGQMSSAFSGFVGGLVNWLFPGTDVSGGGGGHGLLRKLGHFTEFCTLGMLLAWLTGMLCKGKWRLYLLPLAAGILVACLDETIQLFVPGRAGLITDVGIDALGCALGSVLINVSKQLKMKFLEETKQ